MKQSYEPEYDEEYMAEIQRKYEDDIANDKALKSSEESTSIGDAYDVFDIASKVHSQFKEGTRDLVLARYNEYDMSNAMAKFFREQIKFITIAMTYSSFIIRFRMAFTFFCMP